MVSTNLKGVNLMATTGKNHNEPEPFKIESARTLEILQQLIRIRTLLPRGDEKDLIRYISSLFAPSAMEQHFIDHGGNRASMVAILPGRERGRKIAFVGHSDIQTVFRHEDWDYSPFGAHYDEGYVYGRGASSMKGGIAAMLMALLWFVQTGRTPPIDVMLCLCADGDSKELKGATSIAKSGFLEGVEEIVFAEPTDERIGIAQRGGIWLEVKVRGKSCYACQSDLGVNAVEAMVAFHQRLASRIVLPKTPPHPLLGFPSCTLTGLEGGIQVNLVPDEAKGMLDIRLLPDQDHKEIEEMIRATAREMVSETPHLEIEPIIQNSRPSVGMNPSAPLVRRFEKILKSMGKKTERTGLHYLTDACVLVPAIEAPFLFYGPGENVYTCLTNERIALSSVVSVAEVFVRYILSGAH